jgi:DNA-binding IclR family transcriptional regulator
MVNPVRAEGSPPTARALAVVELLVRAANAPVRFVDVSRELDINQATAHAILTTLCEKGWAVRDPVDKTFSVGPALAAIAGHVDSIPPVARAARAAVAELSEAIGYPSSVIERSGDWLVITAFEGGDVPHPAGIPGDRIPFMPPFGVALAAWATIEDQRAWVQRASVADDGVRQRLHQVLAQTRERGFDIDRMTPALAKTAQAIRTLRSPEVPEHLRTTLEQLHAEFTTIGYLAGDSPAGRAQPVATISAPVIDRHGQATRMIGVHPLCALTSRQISVIGRRVTKAAGAVSRTAKGA